MIRTRTFLVSAALLALAALAPVRAGTGAGDKRDYWIEPMKKVHARFTGTKGTLALFGDSITVSMAFWAPLAYEPKNMPDDMAQAQKLVKRYIKPDSWAKWRGAAYGSEGSMTIRWADANVDRWLKKLNPEVAVIMFGTNDLGQLGLKEYDEKTRSVVDRCLANGTVVILTTIPPRSGRLDQARQFADAVKKIGRDKNVPVIDYFGACLQRRPKDWDGAGAEFKNSPGNEYEVPTLIARDGVHPSNPSKFRDFSPESLRSNGYALRNYLTVLASADVIRRVLDGAAGKE
jgi:lysophospholipase L1-like esterase